MSENTQEGSVITWSSDADVVSYDYRARSVTGVVISGTTTGQQATFNSSRFILGVSYTYYVTATNSGGVKSKEASIASTSGIC